MRAEGEGLRPGLAPSPVIGVRGRVIQEKMLKICVQISAIWCNLMTSGHQKWDGKIDPFKSGTEFSEPVVYVVYAAAAHVCRQHGRWCCNHCLQKSAGLPCGWHFNPHTHPIPTGIPIGIPMGIPIPTEPEVSSLLYYM